MKCIAENIIILFKIVWLHFSLVFFLLIFSNTFNSLIILILLFFYSYLVGIGANLVVVVAGSLVEISDMGGTFVTGRSVWAETLRGTALVTTTFSHFLSGSGCCCWTSSAGAAGLRMSIMVGRSLSSWLATAAMLSCTSGDLFFESPEAVGLFCLVLTGALVEVVVNTSAVVVLAEALGAAAVDAATSSRLAARG